MAHHVLLIGHGLFCEGLGRLFTGHDSITVATAASDSDKARRIIAQEQPDILLIEQEWADRRQEELLPLLANDKHWTMVICLSLGGNHMDVHHRRRMNNVTVDSLLAVLQAPFLEAGEQTSAK